MTDLKTHPYAETIYKKLLSHIKNAKGVSALMGNLQAESGLYPDRVQGDVPYSEYSKTYTANVDNGVISESEFVNNGLGGGGYGLAQWTFYTRKQNLYNFWKSGGYGSIGGADLGCDFLIHELKESFPGVYSTLVNTTDILSASNIVLFDFESPADQSSSVQQLRAEMGTEIYNTFNGLSGEDVEIDNNGSQQQKKGKRLSKILLYSSALD